MIVLSLIEAHTIIHLSSSYRIAFTSNRKLELPKFTTLCYHLSKKKHFVNVYYILSYYSITIRLSISLILWVYKCKDTEKETIIAMHVFFAAVSLLVACSVPPSRICDDALLCALSHGLR